MAESLDEELEGYRRSMAVTLGDRHARICAHPGGARPRRGAARPIAAAEQTGLIVPLGDWVLHEACAQAARWQAAGLRPLRVAVNLSARQFRKGRLVEAVRTALAAGGLASRWLMLDPADGQPAGQRRDAAGAEADGRAHGASLGMLTTAEGVETREQLAFLVQHGCRFGQGFLFSPAVAADAFAAMLHEERILGAAA